MYSPLLRRSCSHLTSPSVISYLLDSEVEQQVASFTLKSFTHQRLIRQFWQRIIAKFIVLRCAFANFECVFLLRQSFDLMSGGIVNANHNATHSLSLACKNNTENDSRLLKNRKSWWWVDFLSRAGGRHCFILARDKHKKDQKNLRRKLVDYCPKQGDHKERTLKHRHKQSGWSASMTSKQVFPKRSAKMIDSTEKMKIPLKFGKRTARYNEFGYKPTQMLYNPTALFNNTWILNCKSELIIIVFFADAIIITITSNEQQNHKMYKNSPITNLKPCPFELVEVNFCFLRFLLRWLMATKDANVSWLLNFRVCMFLKRTARMAFKEQGIPYLY